MNRITSIFLFVLLGAGAVAAAIVPFYVMANKDRNVLATNLEMIKERAATIESEKQKLADEANTRVQEANDEVSKAQSKIDALKEDQRLIGISERLQNAGSRELLTWTPMVSMQQHVSVLVPKSSSVESDTGDLFSVIITPTSTDPYIHGETWLEVLPYNKIKEDQLLSSMTSSTEIAFTINKQLLAGHTGVSVSDGSRIYVLTYRDLGEQKSLVFLKEIPALGKNGAQRFLATLAFDGE